MAEVIDIIQKITYEADADVIEAINAQFGTQLKQIQAAQKAVAAYDSQLAKTATDDTRRRQVLTNLIERQKTSIDRLNASIGKQIGENPKLSNSIVDVTGKLRNLSFAGSQLLREAPAFTFSLQTGILALSNNIPILLDQLKLARAEGATTTNIFKALGSSIFSLSGIITLGVAALSIFGDQIFDTGKKSEDAAKDINDVTKAIQDQAKAATTATIAERNRLDIGENQAKRNLEIAKARGASDEELLSLQRRVAEERSNTAQNELDRLQVIEDATRTNYEFFSGLYQNDEYVRKLTANNIQQTLVETLGITKEAAAEEAAAVANSYNTRESVVGKYRLRKRELEESIKDNANSVVIEELSIDRKLREKATKEYEAFIKKRLELIQFLKDRVKEAANELGSDLTDYIEKFEEDLRKRQDQLSRAFSKFPLSPNTSAIFSNGLGRLSDDDTARLNKQLTERSNLQIGISKRTESEIAKNQLKQRRDTAQQTLDEAKRRNASAKDSGVFADIVSTSNDVREANRVYQELNGKYQEYNQQVVSATLEGFQTILNEGITLAAQLYDTQLFYLDKEIELRQRNVEQATLLAERGNTEILRQETERLQKTERERERVAENQLRINSLLAASSAAISAAQAIQTVTNAGATGDPYTAAARIAAAVAALASGFAFVRNLVTTFRGFKDGVVDFEGKGSGTSDSNMVRISRGESVITAKATRDFKPILKAMNDGTFNPAMFATAKANPDRTDEMIAALGQNRTNVVAKISDGQFLMMVEKQSRKKARNFM